MTWPVAQLRSRLIAPLVVLGLASSIVSPSTRAEESPRVAFRAEPGRLKIEVGDKPFATYVFRDETIRRPYLADVRGPGGVQVTRNHPPVAGRDPVDHATMHPGIWLAFGDLSGSDDWRNRARVEHDRFVDEPAGGPGKGTFTVANRYLTNDGALVCTETCRYSVLVRPSGYLLIASSEFRSDSAEIAFGDQEEMGFGLRVATPLAVKNGGRLINSDGRGQERGVWGQAADWCDYSGVVEGRRTGVMLMPDPKNFRRSWFHARDYGLLVANPFGRKAFHQGEASRVVVKPGTPFRLGFAVLVHDAPVAGEIDLAAAYRDYLGLVAQGEAPAAAGPKP